MKSQNDKLELQLLTQAETITRLNHKTSRLTRERMHFKGKCNQLSDERDLWKDKYLEVAKKRRGGGK